MRNIVIKGRPYQYNVGSKTTKINGHFGTKIVNNEEIAKGPVTPGKVTNFIVGKLNEFIKR